MNSNISIAFSKAVEVYRVKVPLIGSEWANRNFYLSPESSGTEGRWRCYPYQIALINWMTDDDIEEINLMKSRRVGYTKCLIAAVASEIEQKNRNVAIWQPTDGDAKDFTIDEIDTMLRDVPVVGEKLKCDVGKKSKFNTNDKKVFHGATLDIKGGRSARNYRRMTKDIAVFDEASAFDRDIDGEGSCFDLGDGRLDAAPFPRSIRGSTPKIKGMDIMEEAIAKCDMVFYRFVKCPQCGTLQRLVFSGLKWHDNDPSTTVYVCKNDCYLEYKQYSTMDANGRWQTLDGYYYSDSDDTFYNPAGEKIDKPKRIGARIWAGYSYLRPWSYVADMWIRATKDMKTGNHSPLKTVVNTLLGETYEEKGESVDSTSMLDRVDDYHPDVSIPNDILFITFGADVQGGKNARVETEILGYGLDDETWSIDYVVIPGDAEQQNVWDHLDDQTLRRFKREDGVELGISGGFVDSGYLSTEVYKFTGPRRRRNIFATKGVTKGMLCNKGSWQGEVKTGRAILHTMNVDDAKTIIFNRLRKITEPGPGYCHFPRHYDEKYFKQLTNEEKREKKKAGRVIGYEWVELGPNEQLDTRAYNLGAFRKINPNLERIKMRLDAEAERLRLGLPGQQRQAGRRVRSRGLHG